jgi:hypothetical protein
MTSLTKQLQSAEAGSRRPLKIDWLYRMPDGRQYCFLGYSDRHCQMHGEYLGQNAHFIQKRDFYSEKKGYWRNGVSLFDAEQVEAVPVCPVPEHARPNTLGTRRLSPLLSAAAVEGSDG